MRLVINNPYNQNYDDFCRYLIEYLSEIKINIVDFDAKLINKWNDYLKIVFPEVTNISIQLILKLFFENQIYYKEDNNYVLTVDKNIKVDGIPLERIVQTISAGALDIQGLDIIGSIYQEVANIVTNLYYQWEAK